MEKIQKNSMLCVIMMYEKELIRFKNGQNVVICVYESSETTS